jgi:hypothetical protein
VDGPSGWWISSSVRPSVPSGLDLSPVPSPVVRLVVPIPCWSRPVHPISTYRGVGSGVGFLCSTLVELWATGGEVVHSLCVHWGKVQAIPGDRGCCGYLRRGAVFCHRGEAKTTGSTEKVAAPVARRATSSGHPASVSSETGCDVSGNRNDAVDAARRKARGWLARGDGLTCAHQLFLTKGVHDAGWGQQKARRSSARGTSRPELERDCSIGVRLKGT